MARIHRYTKGNVTLSDTLVGTDVENQKATVNIPIAAIVDLAIDYFSVNGNGDGINQSLLDITTSVDGAITSIATYQNIVNTLTNEFTSIVNRTETLESVFNTNIDGTVTLSTSNITNFYETIASEGFASATSLNSLSSQVQQIVDGVLVIDTYATIDQLANVTSTLTGSIATLEDTLTTAYRAYTDGILTTDAFASAVSGLVTQSTDTFASSTEYTNLKANFGTFDANGNLLTLASSFANNVVSAYTDDTLATASDISTLDASLRTFVSDSISTASNAGITSSYLTTVLANYATAQALLDLQSSIGTYDANGNITALSSAFANQVTSAISTNTFAQVTDLNELKAEIGTFDANGNLTGLSTAFSTELTDIIANENLASAQSVTDLTATVTQNNTTLSAGVSTNQSAIASVDGKLTASYGLNVTAGNAISGMTLLADGTTNLSEIKFVADKFSIEQPNGNSIAPFVLNNDGSISLNGAVTFSNSSSGTGISQTDLQNYLTNNNYTTTSDLPTEFTTTDLQNYLDAQGYESGGIDATQLATYLSNGGYITDQTTINGGKIETGIIASQNFAMPTNSLTSGFSIDGMGINLDNNSIHAKQFYINADGSANFGGSHTAGSVGAWVVDSGGALKSSASSPAIVLSPGSYTEGTSEKIIISGVNLPAISPSAGVNLDFQFVGGWQGVTPIIPQAYHVWAGFPHNVNNATPAHNLTGANGYFTTPNDIATTQTAFGESNNLGYAHPGGPLEFSMPYAAGTSQAVFDATVQEQFLYEWGARFSTDPDMVTMSRTNPQLNKTGIVEFDYSVKLVTKMYRGSSSDTATTVQSATLEQTFTKTLDSGSKLVDLNNFIQITNQTTDNTFPYPNMNTADANGDFVIDTIYYSAEIGFGNWNEGTQTQGAAPINISAGNIFLISSLEYKIEDIRFWKSTSFSGSGYASGGRFFASLFEFGAWYSSSGGNIASATALTQVLFKGGDPKINIGLNGTQVRGKEGYVALGDITSTDSIAQFWGDTEVIGTITTNSTATFSDERLKQNITPIKNSIETIKLLNPVTYKWNRGKINVSGTKHGFIAQEVRDIMPSTVLGGGQIADVEDALSVEYNNFIAINTSAIKKLIEKIEALEAEIETLKENNG